MTNAEAEDAGDVTIWHHGLIAKWWANFRTDGPEIDYFRTLVETGPPALDLGCGSGRLLVPWVAGGLDVDGADASADMIAECRAAARRVGREPALYVQPMHLLDLPRRYGTIVACGSFGLGTTRELDVEALRRMLAHLRPDGLLALDYEVGEGERYERRSWTSPPADERPPPPAEDRELADDGSEYALRQRLVEYDPDTGRLTREIQAWQWRDGQLVAHERNMLTANIWSRTQLVDALQQVGFADVRVVGGYHGGEPQGDEQFLVYLARRPAA